MKYQLLILANAIAGTILFATSVDALTFELNSYDASNGVFDYNLTLDDGESLNNFASFNIFDTLALNNLGGVTSTSVGSGSPYSPKSFTNTDAIFQASSTVSGTQLYENAVSLTSSNPAGMIDYTATSSSGSFSGQVLGPAEAAVPVPFELSPNSGIFTILGIIGLNYYRKKLKG